jgi:hypothetical protein
LRSERSTLARTYSGRPFAPPVTVPSSSIAALFRRLWTEHRVSAWQTDEKTLYHPVAGAMRFFNSSITVNGVPDQAIYLVVPGDVSVFEAALHASSGVPGSPHQGQ